MRITESEIIEQIFDELATGAVGSEVRTIVISRIGTASLLLDYGESGRFVLTVEEQAKGHDKAG